ncbi:ASCH domain-containing protein [Fontibacillus panacisegetis]|uniref:ASCH domain-containing protein n=1 Tax=Fontibacillus panacisegetis TaxID=670482 RepID=A0A1G7FIP6_9BACL|nr:ASCH domain-containing protein [Fontibacillus panacisegetis]SDE75783.1 ASCH domain-containing protein [Fontibacillus panacisegetis]
MKAITIHQPYATLIAINEKHNETRGWRTNYRGQLAIHAGKKVDRQACEWGPIKSTLEKHGCTADNLPTGGIVAIAYLLECWAIGEDYVSGATVLFNGENGATKDVSAKECKFSDYSLGRYAWELDNVRMLPEPIPAKGQQGLWNWTSIRPRSI